MAENSIFGPQLGLRWFRQRGRWTISAEGRGFFAVNRQQITGGYPIQEAIPVQAPAPPTAGSTLGFPLTIKRIPPPCQDRQPSHRFPTRGWCTPTMCISGSGHRPGMCDSTQRGRSPNRSPWRRAGNGCTSPTVLPGEKAMGQGTHSRVSTTRT